MASSNFPCRSRVCACTSPDCVLVAIADGAGGAAGVTFESAGTCPKQPVATANESIFLRRRATESPCVNMQSKNYKPIRTQKRGSLERLPRGDALARG